MQKPRTDIMLEKILTALEKVPLDEQDVPKIAAYCGWSVWHTQRVFHALTSQPLGQYLRSRKLTEAAKLLQKSRLSVLEISLEVGFNSHEAFTRSFQAYFGIRPKDFRSNAPRVSPRAKPILTPAYIRQLEQISLNPEFEDRAETVLMGIEGWVPSPFSEMKPTFECVLPIWDKLFKSKSTIADRLGKDYFGLIRSESGEMEEEQLNYLACLKVGSCEPDRNGFLRYSLPAGRYAVFKNVGGGNSTVHLIDYIYGVWLPNSNFEHAAGCDFEIFREGYKFLEPGSVSYYHVPIIN